MQRIVPGQVRAIGAVRSLPAVAYGGDPTVWGCDMARMPGGTVTFLFTDIEGSTRRWEQEPAADIAAGAPRDLLAALAGSRR